MAKFHSLEVIDVTHETADSVSVAFRIPDALKEEYKYLQGQYVTLKLVINGEEVRRSYSICTSPVLDKDIRVAIKRVKGGRGSNFINDNLKKGERVEVMTPMGNFHSPLSAANKKHYVLFAGGSGITPMLSIISTVLAVEPDSSVTLFYGNLNEESVIFKKQLSDLANQYAQRFRMHLILDKPISNSLDPIFKGMMTQEKVKELMGKYITLSKDNEYFVCGPTPMMDNVKAVLEGAGVDKNTIHIEYFTSSLNGGGDKKASDPTEAIPAITSQVTVILDGEETVIELSSKGKSVLDAAMDAGVDVPFSCKGAVCCTCRAKVMEGKAVMEKNFALADSEVAAGYILTCQAHPATATVTIDYDQP